MRYVFVYFLMRIQRVRKWSMWRFIGYRPASTAGNLEWMPACRRDRAPASSSFPSLPFLSFFFSPLRLCCFACLRFNLQLDASFLTSVGCDEWWHQCGHDLATFSFLFFFSFLVLLWVWAGVGWWILWNLNLRPFKSWLDPINKSPVLIQFSGHKYLGPKPLMLGESEIFCLAIVWQWQGI